MEKFKETAIIDINEYYRLRRIEDAQNEGKIVTIFRSSNQAEVIRFLNLGDALAKAEEALTEFKNSFDKRDVRQLTEAKEALKDRDEKIERLVAEIERLVAKINEHEKEITELKQIIRRCYSIEELRALSIREIRKIRKDK